MERVAMGEARNDFFMQQQVGHAAAAAVDSLCACLPAGVSWLARTGSVAQQQPQQLPYVLTGRVLLRPAASFCSWPFWERPKAVAARAAGAPRGSGCAAAPARSAASSTTRWVRREPAGSWASALG